MTMAATEPDRYLKLAPVVLAAPHHYSGFHSPIEKECLALLLRGAQPIVICLARNIERMRVPAVWRQPIADGRLLVLSPFAAPVNRATTKLTKVRNEFVAALAAR